MYNKIIVGAIGTFATIVAMNVINNVIINQTENITSAFTAVGL